MANATVWVAIALSFAAAEYSLGGGSRTFSSHLVYALAGWSPWTLLTGALAWWCPRLLRDTSRKTAAVALAGASLLWIALYSVFIVVLEGLLRPDTAAAFGDEMLARFGFWLWFDYSYYWAVVAVVLAVHFQRRERIEAERAESLRQRAADAELRYRVTQLQPHFLFNALNGIAGLARTGAGPAAADAIDELGELLRAALDLEQVSTIRLEQELALLSNYLNIQELRFDRPIELEVLADEQARGARLPPLILQPLVENAVEHGAEEAGRRRVVVQAHLDEHGLNVTVENWGELSGAAEGIGLQNVRGRLATMYGTAATLSIDAIEGHVRATLRVPPTTG